MATAHTDEWTEENCLRLIREYRSKPILWDQKDPFFFKKTLKPVAWQEIAKTMNITADQCKHKMTILMSSFRREKAKIMHSIKHLNFTGDEIDPSLVYKSTWFAFKEMAFLLDKESERKRQIHDSDEEIDDDTSSNASIKLILLSHHLDTPKAKRSKSSPLVTVKRELTPTHTEHQEAIATPRPRQMPRLVGPIQTAAERDEEIKSFTSFIGNKMKRYTDTTKNAVQQAICEIIFKADQNDYENCYENFTIIDDDADPLNKEIFEDDGTIIKLQHESDSD